MSTTVVTHWRHTVMTHRHDTVCHFSWWYDGFYYAPPRLNVMVSGWFGFRVRWTCLWLFLRLCWVCQWTERLVVYSRVGRKRFFFSNLTWVEIKRRVYMRKWAWENFRSLRQKNSDPHDLWKANFFLRNITNVHNIPIFCATHYWIGVVSISITHALNSICESFTLIC